MGHCRKIFFQALSICLALLAFGHLFRTTLGNQIQDEDFLLQIPKILQQETAKTTDLNDGIFGQNDVSNILYNLLIKLKAHNERNQK